MLPKKHPLTKVIANLETLSIETTNPLFINGRGNSYPHGFNLVALISSVAELPLTRALQLGCKPALFSENQQATIRILSELKQGAKVLSVAAWQDATSNLYLVKLFGAKKGTRYPALANRYIRDYDMLYPAANDSGVRCNALWVTHLLCITGEIIFKDFAEHFSAYLNFIFGRWNKVEINWPEYVKRLTPTSTVQDLLDAFVVFEKFKTDTLSAVATVVGVGEKLATADEQPAIVEPVHPLGKYFTGSVPFFEIAVQVHSEIMHFKQIGFNSAKQMLVESTADYALVMIGDKWLVGLMPENTTADHIARALTTLATVKSIWLSKLHVNKVMMLQDSVYTTDGTYLIKFTDKGFIPYGPVTS